MNQRRFAGFDGLRGIAALAVAISHLWAPRYQWWSGILDFIVSYGWIGVDLFFVLSGFLITGILVSNRKSPSYFRTFYTHRALRIFPLYYLLVATVTVFLPLSFPSARWMSVTNGGVWVYWVFFSNQLILQSLGWIYCAWIPTLAQSWSLAIEEQFYIVWSIAVRYLSVRTLVIIALSTIAGGIVLRWAMIYGTAQTPSYLSQIFFFTPTHLDGLAIGILMRLAYGKGGATMMRFIARTWSIWLSASLLMLAFDAMLAPDLQSSIRPLTIRIGFPLLSMGCATIAMHAAFLDTRLRSGLDAWPLRRLGQYSYCIYLFHLPIGALFALVWPAIPDNFEAVVILIAELATTILFAAFSYRWIESPLLALKRPFSYSPSELNAGMNKT